MSISFKAKPFTFIPDVIRGQLLYRHLGFSQALADTREGGNVDDTWFDDESDDSYWIDWVLYRSEEIGTECENLEHWWRIDHGIRGESK